MNETDRKINEGIESIAAQYDPSAQLWPAGSRFNRAMLALDAIDHFSDRHDGEALMGDYDEAATDESDDLAPWPETWDLDD